MIQFRPLFTLAVLRKFNSNYLIAVLCLVNILILVLYSNPSFLPNVVYLPELFYGLRLSWSDIKLAYPNYYLTFYLGLLFLKLIYMLSFALMIWKIVLRLFCHYLKEILLFLAISFCCFILLEASLRMFHMYPGQYIYSPYFHKVNELKEYRGFIGDSNGIFKVDTNISEQIENYVDRHYPFFQLFLTHDFERDILGVYRDFKDNRIRFVKNNFTQHLNEIQNKNEHSKLDDALCEYIKSPINEEGFFSIPFINFHSEHTKVLLLGDSFTWGHSASHKTYSFANELLAKNYIVYNTGISGADVTQYLAIAQAYIPILKPDVVILNFYLGNDVSYYSRVLTPYIPLFYSTNAGNLYSYKNGVLFKTKQEAYDRILKHTTIPNKTWFDRLCSKTSVGSQMWRILLNYKLVESSPILNSLINETSKPACNDEIMKIQKICSMYQTEFVLSVIPDYLNADTSVSDFPFLFENLSYVNSPVPKEFYSSSDGHFNNEGHQEYAKFLDSLIIEKTH